MATELSPVLRQRFFSANGLPLAGGFLHTFAAGTSTPLVTYTDSTGNVENSNPVELDSDGYADVWLGSSSYKFALHDANDVLLWTVDNVQINTLNNFSPYTYPTKFDVEISQSATDLDGETVDGDVYSSVRYEFQVIQGSTIFACGVFFLQYLDGTWQLLMAGVWDNGTPMGVSFTNTQGGTIAQLQAAESGLGSGTITLKKSYFLANP